MKIIYIIFEILNVLIFLHTAYFGLFSLSGLLRKTRVYPDADRERHFAVLIAARNEEAVIGSLVDSLMEADYPPALLDTYVVINNTTDNTAAVAAEHGANVMECTVPTKSKADVLRFAFGQLKDRTDIDAYVIFDADNVVDPGFFREINKVFGAGYRAAQGRRVGKNIKTTWVTSSYEIYYTMMNAYYNHPRNAAGLTASINGTGWAVEKSIIDEHGFPMTTITEDYEYSIWLGMHGIPVGYCKKAITYDEFTEDIKTSITQRFRWSFGMLQALQKYTKKLFSGFFNRSFQNFDLAMLTLLPFVALAAPVISVMAYFFVDIPIPVIPLLLGLAASAWIGTSIAAVISVIKSGDRVMDDIKGIIAFPFFMITWAPLLIACFFKRKMEWTPIKHDRAVSIEDIKES